MSNDIKGFLFIPTFMKKDAFIIRLILIALLYFAICPSSRGEEKKDRIISLAPSTTEILFALGLKDEIIGVSQYCNYPPEALTKEKVGSFSHPDIEKILSLKPDIIFCTGLEQAPVITKLRKLKLKVFVSDPSNFSELFDSILKIGRLLGREAESKILIESMKERIEKVNSKVAVEPEEERPKVFLEIWSRPLMTAGKGSFVDELLTLAGGINIAHDTIRPYCYFSAEEVVRRNPDCIILAYMEKENPQKTVGRRMGWNQISAVKNNRIFADINPDIFLRPGPRLVEGLEEFHKRLYLKDEDSIKE